MHSLFASSAVILIVSGHSLAEEVRGGAEPARYEQPCQADGQDNELTVLHSVMLSDGKLVDVTIVTACLDLATYPRPHSQHWNIIPSVQSMNSGVRYIRDLIIAIDGGNWILPVSAYGDLLFITDLSAEIEESGPGVNVRLTGGSDMGEWIATLRFEGGALIERYVTTSTFPDEAFQRTQYGRPMDN